MPCISGCLPCHARKFYRGRHFAQQHTTVSTHDSVLVGGESVTRHNRSERSSGRFVALNCAGVAETLLESELFGHVATITTVGFRAATER